MIEFFFSVCVDNRDIHGLTDSYHTRRSSDLASRDHWRSTLNMSGSVLPRACGEWTLSRTALHLLSSKRGSHSPSAPSGPSSDGSQQLWARKSTRLNSSH